MLSNKDIRVENGNLIINGDKHPLDTNEIKEEVDALSVTVGDETGGLVKEVNDLSDAVVVKRFYIEKGSTTLDTGINVNNEYTIGFCAIVSTFNTYDGGIVSLYIGGVAHNKQDGSVGTLSTKKIDGVGISGSTDAENIQFSVIDDKLQLTTYPARVGACITLILTKKD